MDTNKSFGLIVYKTDNFEAAPAINIRTLVLYILMILNYHDV
jgi:hypothetical protein